MRSLNPPHLVLASAALLLVAGCSKHPSEEAASEATEATENVAAVDSSVASEARRDEARIPDIGQAVAPGVAFTYRYAFTLPVKAIAGVQQQHAAACERLGAKRCQVVGMSYDQPEEGKVSAHLDLMLAPEIAHGFGSEAIAAVEKADGSIGRASVAGDDAGGAIAQSQRRSGALEAQLGRIEARLKAPGTSKQERRQLAQRAEELRSQLGEEQRGRQDSEASLATTPMSLTYASEGLFSATSDPFGKAAVSSFGSLQGFLAFLLTAAGLLLPWLLLGALVVLLFRFRAMKQRLAEATGGAADPTPPQ